MPSNLKDLRNRIKSIKNTQKITKVMQLVSASKFGRSQATILNARPYTFEFAKFVKHLVSFVPDDFEMPLLTTNSSKTALVLVLSSERGLCGGYNSNIIKLTHKVYASLTEEGYQISFACIGKKAFQALLRKKSTENKKFNAGSCKFINEKEYEAQPDIFLNSNGLSYITTLFEKKLDETVEPLSRSLSLLYEQEKIGKLVVVYSKFQSAMVQIPVTKTIFPLSFSESTSNDIPDGLKDTIFEPTFKKLLEIALPRYILSQILTVLLEARASEYGARMTAMDNATRNSKEIEKKLQLTYQRARQATITNELIEIISGAEAL